MIRGTLKIGDAEKVPLRITLDMTVEEARLLVKRMDTSVWPDWDFARVLQALLTRAVDRVDMEHSSERESNG